MSPDETTWRLVEGFFHASILAGSRDGMTEETEEMARRLCNTQGHWRFRKQDLQMTFEMMCQRATAALRARDRPADAAQHLEAVAYYYGHLRGLVPTEWHQK